jgi:secreted trypsin-like serine protease
VIVLLIISISCDTSSYVCDKNSVPCGCGEINVGTNARIVNGENSIPNSWSMIVSLKIGQNSPVHTCGGTIVSESYILTAAHCVDWAPIDFFLKNLTIAAGIHNLSQPDQIIRRVDKIIIHPLWAVFAHDLLYDIALIHLVEPLNLAKSSRLTRTCLPPHTNSLEETMQYPSNGTSLVVIGWGRLETAGAVPDILQQVTVNSIGHFDRICSNTIRDPSSQFCAGLYEGGKSKK